MKDRIQILTQPRHLIRTDTESVEPPTVSHHLHS